MKELVKIKIDPKYINFFNRIMEGYEYLGTVSTINNKEGIVIVRATPDTFKEVEEVIANLPFHYSLIEE
ncbi:DUF4911 domain-containing protein [Anaerosinus sp.]|uniref:DUF4911 domain-containing protein n=1 Tax=Selenobaculum sp. TaxID=3074374 RepID=UPI0015AEECB2